MKDARVTGVLQIKVRVRERLIVPERAKIKLLL